MTTKIRFVSSVIAPHNRNIMCTNAEEKVQNGKRLAFIESMKLKHWKSMPGQRSGRDKGKRVLIVLTIIREM